MIMTKRSNIGVFLGAITALVATSCVGDDTPPRPEDSGGNANVGGSSTGNTSATGGTKAVGGSSNIGGQSATGGSIAAGGTAPVGGTPSTGGINATGGVTSSVSSNATGGSIANGGTISTGGTIATAGTTSTGGTSATAGTTTTGAASATGGTPGTGGTKTSGGATSSGGSSATGGTITSVVTPSTGGTIAAGGTASTGGISAAGGNTATGGAVSTGGTSAAGGTTTTGGVNATGGSPSTGGTIATGGSANTGGAPATGGTTSTGGMLSTGGTPGAGGTTSAGAATGGTPGAGGTTAVGGTGTAVTQVSQVIVADATDKNYRIVDGQSGNVIKTIPIPGGQAPCGLGWAPPTGGFVQLPDYSGEYILGCTTKSLYYLENDTLQQTIDLSSWTYMGGMTGVNPSGAFLDIATNNGTVLVDVDHSSSGFNSYTFQSNGDLAGLFTPDGTRAYALVDGEYGSIAQVRVTDTHTYQTIATIQLPQQGACYASATISPSGTRLYVAGWCSRKVVVVDIDPSSSTYHTVLQQIAVSGEARMVMFRPSGDYAYVTLDTGGLSVLATSATSPKFNTEIAYISNAGSSNDVHTVDIALDGRFAYVAAGSVNPNVLYVIDSDPLSPTFNTLVRTFAVGPQPYVVGIRPAK